MRLLGILQGPYRCKIKIALKLVFCDERLINNIKNNRLASM